jgi:hypothetical protein
MLRELCVEYVKSSEWSQVTEEIGEGGGGIVTERAFIKGASARAKWIQQSSFTTNKRVYEWDEAIYNSFIEFSSFSWINSLLFCRASNNLQLRYRPIRIQQIDDSIVLVVVFVGHVKCLKTQIIIKLNKCGKFEKQC